MKRAYTVDEAAEASGVSRSNIDAAIAKGELIAHTLNEKARSKRVIHVEDLDAWLHHLPVYTRAS
jgi:excisionase family DNA binding protein